MDNIVTLKSKQGNIIPVSCISITSFISHFVADVEVVFSFVNDSDHPLETTFSFYQENITLYEFTAEMKNRKLKSICHQTQKSFEIFDNSIASGNGSYLLEKEDSNDDIFKISVGNLPAKEECRIKIKYTKILGTKDDDDLQFKLPFTKVPFSRLSIQASVTMPSKILQCHSINHQIESVIENNTATFSLDSSSSSSSSTKEFVVSFILKNPHSSFAQLFPSSSLSSLSSSSPSSSLSLPSPPTTSPSLLSSLLSSLSPFSSSSSSSSSSSLTSPSPKDDIIMLSLFPKIEKDDEVEMEYIFLVDRSGSMSGNKIEQLKNALQLFLRSIPFGSLFNIVGFGSTYQMVFSSSAIYNNENFAIATKHAASIQANLGGTDIYEPLEAILSQSLKTIPNNSKFYYPRQVIVLTDGDVTNSNAVLNLARKKLGAFTRIFTIGIGADAGVKLVSGLAKFGKGMAEFVTAKQRIETTVLAQLQRAMKPYLQVSVDWGDNENIIQTPSIIPPIFPGDPIIVFGLVKGAYNPSITLKIRNGRDNLRETPISLSSGTTKCGKMIGVLAAASSIREIDKKLDDKLVTEDEAKALVLPLALKYSLVTRYTSLVIEEIRAESTEGTMEIVKIDIPDILPAEVKNTKVKDTPEFMKKVVARNLQREIRKLERNARKETLVAKKCMQNNNRDAALIYVRKKKDYEDQIRKMRRASIVIQNIAKPEKITQIHSAMNQGTFHVDDLNSLYQSDMQSSISECLSEEMMDDNLLLEEELMNMLDEFGVQAIISEPLPLPRASSNNNNDNTEDDELERRLRMLKGDFSPLPEKKDDTKQKEDKDGQKAAERNKQQQKIEDKKDKQPIYNSSQPIFLTPNRNQRPLDSFILLQTAEGYWQYSEDFLKITKLTKEKIESILGEYLKLGETIYMTALAVFVLEIIFKDNKEEWILLRDKALRWMKREMEKQGSNQMENLLSKAKLCLS